MAFGARIAELRRTKGESLQHVANAVGVTKTHIWELEKGRTGNPSMAVITALADHFHVSIASLVGEDIDAADADQQLAHMFRLATDLDEDERQTLQDLINSFRNRKAGRAVS